MPYAIVSGSLQSFNSKWDVAVSGLEGITAYFKNDDLTEINYYFFFFIKPLN